MTHSPRQAIGIGSAAVAVLVSILWGGNIVSIRLGVDSVPPLWSAFWRMLLGLVFVAAWAYRQGVRLWPIPGEGVPLFSLGLLFTIQIALLNKASALTSPGYGVVILNSYAVFANLAGHFFAAYPVGARLEERLTKARVLGLALALGGLVVLSSGRISAVLAPDLLLGNTLMTISALLLGVRQVYTRYLVQTIDPVRGIVWQIVWSLPLFLLAAAISEPPTYGAVTWQAVAAIGYQGIVVAGLCFILWAQLLRKHPAGALSMYAFITPVSGMALAALIFGEPLSPYLLAGSALVLLGVYQARSRRS